MWQYEEKVKTKLSKEKVWELWRDVKNWNKWDIDVKHSEIFSEFISGGNGVIQPMSGPKIKFVITDCKKLKSFTTVSYIPFCKIYFIHNMIEINGELEISHKVEIKGPLTFFFSRVIGNQIKKTLGKSMINLVAVN